MKRVRRAVRCFLGALGVALFTSTASADPINLDQWYTFTFNDPVGPLLAFQAGFVLGQRSVGIPEPPWTFDCPFDHCKLTVTDGFQAIDQFELFDNNISLG